MDEVKKIRRIERRRKYIIGDSKRLRERSVCPDCNSLDISKRSSTRSYICYNCGWTGNKANKVMC